MLVVLIALHIVLDYDHILIICCACVNQSIGKCSINFWQINILLLFFIVYLEASSIHNLFIFIILVLSHVYIYICIYKQAQAHTFMRVKSKYSIECSVSFRMLYGVRCLQIFPLFLIKFTFQSVKFIHPPQVGMNKIVAWSFHQL